MNILQVRSEFWDNGPGTQSLEIAKELRRRGHNVYFASSGGVLAEEIEQNGFKHFDIPTLNRHKRGPLSTFKNVKALGKIIKDFEIDIIHGHNAAATFCGYLASKTYKKGKVGITQSVRGLELRKYYQWRNGIYKIYPAFYFAVSEYTKSELEKLNVDPKNIKVTYNGIDVTRFNEKTTKDSNSIREELNIDADTKIISIVGKINGSKGQEVLIKGIPNIVNRNKNVRFLFIGQGPNLEHCKKLCREYKVNDFVHFLGFRRDIPNIQAQSDIFVLPSVWGEMFPNVILEAMAMKTPWVSTRLAGIPEMSEQNTTGFIVDPGNHEQLTEKINYLIENDDIREKMGQKCKELVHKKYQIKHVVDRVLEGYETSIALKDGK